VLAKKKKYKNKCLINIKIFKNMLFILQTERSLQKIFPNFFLKNLSCFYMYHNKICSLSLKKSKNLKASPNIELSFFYYIIFIWICSCNNYSKIFLLLVLLWND